MYPGFKVLLYSNVLFFSFHAPRIQELTHVSVPAVQVNVISLSNDMFILLQRTSLVQYNNKDNMKSVPFDILRHRLE